MRAITLAALVARRLMPFEYRFGAIWYGIAEVPTTRNKVNCADWSAGIQPAFTVESGNKSSVVQDRQFIVDRQGGPSYRSKKLRHDTIAPSWMGVI